MKVIHHHNWTINISNNTSNRLKDKSKISQKIIPILNGDYFLIFHDNIKCTRAEHKNNKILQKSSEVLKYNENA